MVTKPESGKQGADSFFDEADGDYLDLVAAEVETTRVVLGDDDAFETQPGGFGNALLDAGNGPDFTTETYLGSQAGVRGHGDIYIGGEDGSGNGEVDGWVGDAEAAGDIEEYVFGPELESASFLEYGKKQVEPPEVEARSVALGGAIDGAADEALHLDENGPRALECGADGGAAEGLVTL